MPCSPSCSPTRPRSPGPTNQLTKADLEAAQKLHSKKKTFTQYVADISEKLGAPMKTEGGRVYWYANDDTKTCFAFTVSKSEGWDTIGSSRIQADPSSQKECDK